MRTARENGNFFVARPAEPKTLADQLRLQLSDDIVRGHLSPGVALDETEIAKQYGVSRTPVREAIRLLAASGLVEARPHRSAMVARPSTQQILGMFEALRELECLCASLAADRMSKAQQVEIGSVNRALRHIVRTNDPARYYLANEAFHNLIYAGAHNAYLAELTAATRARIAPFSRAQFHTSGRLGKSHAEHQRILKAIAHGDGAAAAAAMREHIVTVHDAYAVFSREI